MGKLVIGLWAAALLVASAAAGAQATDPPPAAAPEPAASPPAAPPVDPMKESLGFVEASQVTESELKVKDSSGLVSNYPGFINSKGGSGRNLRIRVPVPRGVFLQAEHQINRYDGFDRGNTQPADLTLFRAGLGMRHPRWPVYGLVETIRQEVEFGIIETFESSGYGARVGIHGGRRATYFAEVGYVDVGDFGSGLEYAIGGSFRMTPVFALFADYRVIEQEDDAGGAYELADLRIGLRMNFIKGEKKAKPRGKKPATPKNPR